MTESPLLDRYVERYGQDAATVATVIALAQRAESFDHAIYDTEIVEAFFYRVPNSTLIVNRVETNDQYGESRTFTVLDEDEPLLAIGASGQLEFNHLTFSQSEALQTVQREGASPLVVKESYFQVDMAQGFTKDGAAQARAILSQGDVITPDMVTALNDLLAAEEDLRRSDQAEHGLSGHVRYPRFTEQALNQYLSADAIARQLSGRSPLLDVQAVVSPDIAQTLPPDVERQAADQVVLDDGYEQIRAEGERPVQPPPQAQLLQPIPPSLEKLAAGHSSVLMPSVSDYLDAMTPETLGAMVYAQYYRWADRYLGFDTEPVFVQHGFLVESLGNALGSYDPMLFRVIDVATDRVVMDFTLAEGRWVEREQTPAEVAQGQQPETDYTSDTVKVSAYDESVQLRLVSAFEDLHRKAGLVASTYLNGTSRDVVSLSNGLFFQREYEEDGSIGRDLTFSRDAVSSDGRTYAIAQAFPNGIGTGLAMPLDVEWLIGQEFTQLVEEYEQSQAQATAQPLQQSQELTAMPNVYDRPKSELERLEAFAMTLLQAGETLVSPAIFTEGGQPLLPPMQLSFQGQFRDGQPLIRRVYKETEYSPGQRSLHSSGVLHDGVLQAMQDGTLETADGQLVRLPDLLTWEQLNAPALKQVEGLGYVLTQDAESAYRTQWTSNLPLPSLAESIRAIPDYEGGVPLLKQLLDGQLTLLQQPQVSLEQGRTQVELQARPTSPVESNGQRVTVALQAPTNVAPNVQPPTLKPKEVPMTVIEAPAPVDLKPIQLDDMLSAFGKDAMRGIAGTRTTYNPTTKRRETEERTPGETFAKFAKGAYGIENFCKNNGIPFAGSADYLVNKAALELDLSPEFKAEILSGIKREECVAPVILATESEAAAWKRVYELAPETFAAVASPTMQATIAQDASVIAQAKAKTLETLGITMKTAEPTRDPVKLGYEPAPATPETAALGAFRDSLTASQLREWATAVQVNEPQNTDKQKWVADFTAKFQKSGYEMSDGGMSVGMAKRLTEVQQQLEPEVAQLRTEMAATINQMLSHAPTVEGKDYKKLDAQSLGLTIKGNEGNFEVKGANGKLLMLAKDGDVTINRLPATVVSRMEGMVDMQQKMQQATVQQTVVAPTKKAAAMER